MAPELIDLIRERLLRWYRDNRRDLPFRGNPDPYAIVVSEFMLQQTGVERVRLTFERFVQVFPDFESLACAPIIEVLRAWAGLGYNRRAVRLRECAMVICRDYGGKLPHDPGELAALPGVGPYTAAAIRSFVYGEDVVALDTNVRRVVARVWFGGNAPDRQINDAATRLLPPGRSAEWNQALMDFGALQCVADRPRCSICPVMDLCSAVKNGSVADVPRRVAETSEPYRGSRRFIRGRIVALLRDLLPGDLLALEDLILILRTHEIAIDPDSLRSLLGVLEQDHLCLLVERSGSILVGPPR